MHQFHTEIEYYVNLIQKPIGLHVNVILFYAQKFL